MYSIFQDPRLHQNTRRRQDRQNFFPSFSDSLFVDPFFQNNAEDESVQPQYGTPSSYKQRQLREQKLREQQLAQQRENQRQEAALKRQQLQQGRQQRQQYQDDVDEEEERGEDEEEKEEEDEEDEEDQPEELESKDHRHRHQHSQQNPQQQNKHQQQQKHQHQRRHQQQQAQAQPQQQRQQQQAQAQPQQQRQRQQPQKQYQQQSTQEQQQLRLGQQHAHGSKRSGRRRRKSETQAAHQVPSSQVHAPAQTEAAAPEDDDMESLVEAAFGDLASEPEKPMDIEPASTVPTFRQPSSRSTHEPTESSESQEAEGQGEHDETEVSEEEALPVYPELLQKSEQELSEIEVNLGELSQELDQIVTGKISNRKKVLMTEENLIKAMLKIDAVESGGNGSIRKRRKELIGRVEQLLAKVDDFKRRAMTVAK
ncbi:hypothetical protein BC939DRAFT_473560 [Gamsiella multidivaricata]|uniref:uncharacterized protein n=1 Tax=Gamsiella multidivaricata TaxID=101098 RepID=UPI00221FC05D|nr:uncharacterized protein BC939DRAFT_473560 [Gamsiella multidivaricata]KAG0369633.1 hypothetical protein BGZ54_009365 [Gamsiella multidivaricata]KAI7830756.1 hypothetical protein BC939DRAFT_473560 [Gamsiella multidivaricata]